MAFFKVRIREGIGHGIKMNALQLDGFVYNFEHGWELDDDIRYPGESAWLPQDDGYPKNAPSWIASGDLIRMKEDSI